MSYIKQLFCTLILIATIATNGMAFGNEKDYLSFDVKEKNFVDTIPIVYRYGQILMPVTIEGRAYNFLLDTGAGVGLINLPTDIKFNESQKSISFSDANSQSLVRKTVTLPELKIGNLTLRNYPCVISKTPFSCANDGIIGFNLIRKGIIIKIDLRAGHIILTDKKKFFKNEPGYKSKYICTDVPIVQFATSYGKSRELAVFDTGYNQMFSINLREIYDLWANPNINKEAVEFSAQTVWTGMGSSGSISVNGTVENEEHFMNLKHLNTFGVSFDSVPCTASPNFCNIGGKLLKYGTMIIDNNTHRMIFQPYTNSNHIDVNERVQNFTVSLRDNTLFVSKINEASDEYAQGLRVNDAITEVEGIAVSNYCDLIEAVADIKRSYFVKFRGTDGKEKQVLITK